MKIVVLAGGASFERNVSLVSGANVAKALRQEGQEVALVDVYLGIAKNINLLDEFKNSDDNSQICVDMKPPTHETLKALKENHEILLGERVIEICQLADIAFIALHGEMGEDGKIQSVLDLHNIKYTGSSALSSAVAMDKHIAKVLMQASGVGVAKWLTYKEREINIKNIIETVKLPCVVKPINSGSSVGVSIVDTKEELVVAIDEAKKYSEFIMFEEKITGREIQVGILGDTVLPPIEIIPNKRFFDYESKYQQGVATEVCPAEIPEDFSKKVQKEALKVFKALNLENYARIDFMMTPNGEFYCLEANTLPGMTPTSLFPQEAKAVGIDYRQLCLKIIDIAIKK